MIDRSLVSSMFEDMRTKYGWDLSQPLVWSFFFTGGPSSDWAELQAILSAEGYDVQPLIEDDERLQADRVVRLSEDELNTLNDKLADLAADLGTVYDGMECGPYDQTQRKMAPAKPNLIAKFRTLFQRRGS